ncbi:lipid IV(A) 3-deoxy-D-manno-octulosonic acid transferase [Helicobacter sp.]|uniref:lipid IV(A) 3-deoxy-D-manno-octulosonic acid transferase n=1 Tax=Helicobacter sp. TaxID=218 RepID=UPI0025BD0AD7|nr:lipid IV(A) 3-deoxy-D-manno-octulosonic acid transferase [Helicobacter sp.]MBR2495261.1 lipid IV(A) 3-deoxy-D-manno-octulosonic acid transferase [Helicobacter sp.]
MASKPERVSIALYYLLCAFAWGLLMPLFFYLSIKPKYHRSIPARFFPFLRQLMPHSGGFCKDFSPHIWLHACSFGEIKSLTPIIQSLIAPGRSILLTTTTQTGFDLAQSTYASKPTIRVEFLPFELFLPFYKRRLQNLQTLIITEAELWLGAFHTAKCLGAQTLLINARISTRSYPKYRYFRAFYRLLFSYVDRVFAQSQADKDRLSTLGACHIEVLGNLKLLSPITTSATYPKPSRLVIVAASTHQSEEELVLQAFSALKKLESNQAVSSLLVLAPRHPERFAQVAANLVSYPFASARFTQGSQVLNDPKLDVVLLDTLGELNNCYAIADIVILGGAFVQAGGHNPLEPAFFHTKLISGKAIFNQEALFACIDGYTLCEASELEETLLAYQSLPKAGYKPMPIDLSTLAHIITRPKQSPQHRGSNG